MTLSANNPSLKVVLLHDWLTGLRGGERVLEAFCELFPNAPIYTLVHVPGSTSSLIESREIVTSFLNRVPGIDEHYRKFLPLMPAAADHLVIRHEAQLVLSSSHCVIKGVRRPPGAKHLSYVHSPMRYIYDQFDSYFGHTSLPVRAAAHLCRPYLALWDRQSNTNVDRLVANSAFVAERIRHCYGRESRVIHPFVDLADFRDVQRAPPPKENFFVMVTAFAPNKRVDLAVAAFNALGPTFPLKIVGSGSAADTRRLREAAAPHVEFLGNVPRAEVISLMARARAFVFPGVEDFGITPLESMAAGTPVIAFRAGGVLETLTDATAEFFDVPSPEALVAAVRAFDPCRFTARALFDRAEHFSKEKFKFQILEEIHSLVRS